MTVVTIHRDDCLVTAEGHSGYAPAGQDIVCAGVSTLLQTFAERLMSHGFLEEDAQLEDGFLAVKGIPVEPVRWWLDFVAAGLQMIEEEFPDNLSVVLIQ